MSTAVVGTRTTPVEFLPTITVPESIEDAVGTLNGLAGLAFASEWARAAIVYAFTTDGTRGGDTSIRKSENAPLTPHAFAALGISGLGSDNTVRAYRRAWQWAMQNSGAPEPQPGQPIQVPPVGWNAWSDYKKQLAISKVAERFTSRSPDAAERILSRNPASVRETLEIGETILPDVKPEGQFPVADQIIDAINVLRGAINAHWSEVSHLKRRYIIDELQELVGDLEDSL